MSHPKEERTLMIIKPDGIQRSLVGEIIRRYERVGLKLIGLKMFVPSPKMIGEHYLLNPGWKRMVGEKAIESYKKRGLKPSSENTFRYSSVTRIPSACSGSENTISSPIVPTS